jgi:hypothetical protein
LARKASSIAIFNPAVPKPDWGKQVLQPHAALTRLARSQAKDKNSVVAQAGQG